MTVLSRLNIGGYFVGSGSGLTNLLYGNIINKPDLAWTANLDSLSTSSTLNISNLQATSTTIFHNLNSLSSTLASPSGNSAIWRRQSFQKTAAQQ